jgi:hypothetical protein
MDGDLLGDNNIYINALAHNKIDVAYFIYHA